VRISLISDVKIIPRKGKTQHRKLSEEMSSRGREITIPLRTATRISLATLRQIITTEEAEILLRLSETAAVATIIQLDARGKFYEVN